MLTNNIIKKIQKTDFNKYKIKRLSDKKHCIKLNWQDFFSFSHIYNNNMPYSCILDLIKYILYSLHNSNRKIIILLKLVTFRINMDLEVHPKF